MHKLLWILTMLVTAGDPATVPDVDPPVVVEFNPHANAHLKTVATPPVFCCMPFPPPPVVDETAMIAENRAAEPVPLLSQPAPQLGDTPARAPHSGSGCSRVGTFTHGELVACFGAGWAGVAMCESSGRTDALNPRDTNGLQSLGLVQFQQPTWDGEVRRMGRLDLVGVDPRTLPADVQMMVAESHRQANGLRPWGCGWAWGT